MSLMTFTDITDTQSPKLKLDSELRRHQQLPEPVLSIRAMPACMVLPRPSLSSPCPCLPSLAPDPAAGTVLAGGMGLETDHTEAMQSVVH